MIKSGDYFEYQGCLHIHSTDSDGAKSIEEIAEIAAGLDLDFIGVSDHMTLKSRKEGKEGYYRNTFVLIGYEHNDREDCNHYLLFDIDEVISADLDAVDYVAEGRRRGALGIIAHPDEIRPRHGKFPSYPWLAWNAEGFEGIEIWNQMSEWMEKLTPLNKIKMLFQPRRFMDAPTDRILKLWDDMNRERKISGVCGIDVHAYPLKIGPFKYTIFPYKVQFKSLRTHLLLAEELSPDVGTAAAQIIRAIRDCRVFISNYRWGDAVGFTFQARRGATTVISGGSLPGTNDVLIIVKSPRSGMIRLIGNGKRILEVNGDFLEYKPSEKGVYRAEVYREGKGWIFSNHIRIGL